MWAKKTMQCRCVLVPVGEKFQHRAAPMSEPSRPRLIHTSMTCMGMDTGPLSAHRLLHKRLVCVAQREQVAVTKQVQA